MVSFPDPLCNLVFSVLMRWCVSSSSSESKEESSESESEDSDELLCVDEDAADTNVGNLSKLASSLWSPRGTALRVALA